MAYASSDYQDLIETTLRHLDKVKWTDIVVDLQRHTAMPQLLKKNRVEFGSGHGHQFNLRVDSNNAARNVKLNEEDNPTTADTQIRGQIDWRHSETHWAIEERIIAMNREPARLVNLLKTSRVDCMTSLAGLMEENFWGPPPAKGDSLKPLGVNYWIALGGDSDKGFLGNLPESGGYVAGDKIGGVDPANATYGARWKNYVDFFSKVSKSDLIRGWREAAVKTDFRPPVDGPYNNVGQQFAFYTSYAIISRMEEILESQNQNLGNDVASKEGLTTFRRTSINWVPFLDVDQGNVAQNRVYGINWKNFMPVFLSGEYMRESKVAPHPLHHRTITQYIDCTYNFLCNDRRSQFVLKDVS